MKSSKIGLLVLATIVVSAALAQAPAGWEGDDWRIWGYASVTELLPFSIYDRVADESPVVSVEINYGAFKRIGLDLLDEEGRVISSVTYRDRSRDYIPSGLVILELDDPDHLGKTILFTASAVRGYEGFAWVRVPPWQWY